MATSFDLSAIGIDVTGFGPAFCRNISRAPHTLMQVGRCGYMYGTGADVVAASKVIPGGTVKGGCFLKSTILVGKYAPATGGGYVRIKFRQGVNSVTVLDCNVVTAAMTQSLDHEVFISPDGRWAYPKGSTTQNSFNSITPTINATYSLSGVLSTQNGSASPISQSNIAFATYNTAPRVETLLIDWSQDVTVEVTTRAIAADRIELQGFNMTMHAVPDGEFTANSKLIVIYGDSLTEGSGSSLTGSIPNDWVSQFGRLRAGTPMVQLGMAGQRSAPIVDRLVADRINGKYAKVVLWIGTNDIGVAADPAATVKAQIERVIAYRGGSQNLMILNLIPSDDWTAPQIAQKDAVNAMLATEYPSIVCDIQTPLCAGGVGGLVNNTYQSDAIHLNNTGYGVVAAAADSFATSIGWAA